MKIKNHWHKYFFFALIIWGGSFLYAHASIIDGTIDPVQNTVQICENTACSVTSTSPVNFGNFTTESGMDVHVTDTELTGYIWGANFGWAVLDCSHTTSGCSSTNGNFKVANDHNGHLSGYGWGENAGWINFGPFTGTTPAVQSVVINSSGQFNGYAWAQNYGWIKFDCTTVGPYCVETDWRPQSTRPQCSDGIDNDGNGLIDSADPACHTDRNAGNPSSYDPYNNIEFTSHGHSTSVLPPPSSASAQTPTPSTAAPIPVTNPDLTPTPPIPISTPAPAPSPVSTPEPASRPGSSIPYYIRNKNGVPQNAGKVITNGISQSFAFITDAAVAFVKKISQVVSTSAGTMVAETVSTVGIIAGTSVSVATLLFANPLSASDLSLILLRLWALLLTALGLKKRNKPWGTVYDSITKQPLDPAYVVLKDMNDKEVATSITDLDGRYGFLLTPGTYKLEASKTNYVFPSTKMAGKTGDELYNNLHFGETITVRAEGELFVKNIPMDPLKFDWNEFTKKQQHLMKFYSRRDILVAHISNILFALGFFIAMVAVLVSPHSYNLIIFALYILLFILRRTVLKNHPQATVTDLATGNPLSFAIIRIYRPGNTTEIIHKITDKTGSFYCLIPNGTYTLTVEKKNEDGGYTLVYTSGSIEVKKGYLDANIQIQDALA